MKISNFDEFYSLSLSVHSICRQMALRKLRVGRRQDALLWAIKAGDGPLATSLVDSLLFDENGDVDASAPLLEPALLDALRSALPAACADSLGFLTALTELRAAIKAKEWRSAIEGLVELVKGDAVPKR
jgi:hypothetical protein